MMAVGFEPREVRTSEELESALNELSVDESVAMVVCGESLAGECEDAVMNFRRNGEGVVLVVPDGTLAQGIGREQIRLAIERAAGVDLLGKTENA